MWPECLGTENWNSQKWHCVTEKPDLAVCICQDHWGSSVLGGKLGFLRLENQRMFSEEAQGTKEFVDDGMRFLWSHRKGKVT